MDLNDMAAQVTKKIREGTHAKTLVLEPGRYIIADTTVLLTRVVDIKDTGEKRTQEWTPVSIHWSAQLSMDSSIMSQWRTSSRHQAAFCTMLLVRYASPEIIWPRTVTTPVGRGGHHFRIDCAGAYGFTMSSQYNMRPKMSGGAGQSRNGEPYPRKENFDDLVRLDRIPSRLLI